MPLLKGSGYGYGFGDGSGYGDGYGLGDGYGFGDCSGSGSGSGSGYGDGYGYGFGSGSGYGYGYGYGDGGLPVACEFERYSASYSPVFGVLCIGCECHTLDDWIAKADEIDARHGDGIADKTRALAQRLKDEIEGARGARRRK